MKWRTIFLALALRCSLISHFRPQGLPPFRSFQRITIIWAYWRKGNGLLRWDTHLGFVSRNAACWAESRNILMHSVPALGRSNGLQTGGLACRKGQIFQSLDCESWKPQSSYTTRPISWGISSLQMRWDYRDLRWAHREGSMSDHLSVHML